MKSYRSTFHGRNSLLNNGLSFSNHYIASAACVPSRVSLYTGQSPLVHGVLETDGIAKGHDDPNFQWLPPNFIPTIGDYLRAGNYDTSYMGKWHVTNADEVDEVSHVVEDIRPRKLKGKVDKKVEEAYKSKNKLSEYGFDDWKGPDPHGPAMENSGVWRDPLFTSDAVSWLKSRASSSSSSSSSSSENKPFFLAVNLVNPHDVCLAGLWYGFSFPFDDETNPVPDVPDCPSRWEDLSTKPSIQKQYRDVSGDVFSKNVINKTTALAHLFDGRRRRRPRYEEFYYYLHSVVDGHIADIQKALSESPFFNDTIVILTSDHGELLNSHGGMLQKWHVAYEEVVHVPFVVSNPRLFGEGGRARTVDDVLTSHVDIVPTIIGLAGLKEKDLAQKLELRMSNVLPLRGKDLSSFILGGGASAELKADELDAPVYFSTRDNVFNGIKSTKVIGIIFPELNFLSNFTFEALYGHNAIEMCVAWLSADGSSSSSSSSSSAAAAGHTPSKKKLYKITRYFDDPSMWSTPFVEHVYTVRSGKSTLAPTGTVLRRTLPLTDEFELYCLDDDPSEVRNLADAKVMLAGGVRAENEVGGEKEVDLVSRAMLELLAKERAKFSHEDAEARAGGKQPVPTPKYSPWYVHRTFPDHLWPPLVENVWNGAVRTAKGLMLLAAVALVFYLRVDAALTKRERKLILKEKRKQKIA